MQGNELCADVFPNSCSPQALPLDASIVFKVRLQNVIPAYPDHLRHIFNTMSLDGAIKIQDLQSLQKNSKFISKHVIWALYNINIHSNFMLFDIIFLLIYHQKEIPKYLYLLRKGRMWHYAKLGIRINIHAFE